MSTWPLYYALVGAVLTLALAIDRGKRVERAPGKYPDASWGDWLLCWALWPVTLAVGVVWIICMAVRAVRENL